MWRLSGQADVRGLPFWKTRATLHISQHWPLSTGSVVSWPTRCWVDNFQHTSYRGYFFQTSFITWIRNSSTQISLNSLWSCSFKPIYELTIGFSALGLTGILFEVVPHFQSSSHSLWRRSLFSKFLAFLLCCGQLQRFILGLTLVFLNTSCHLINFSFSCFVERLTGFQLLIISVHVNSTNMHNPWFNSVPSDFYLVQTALKTNKLVH